MHSCFKCFIQQRVTALVAHTHATGEGKGLGRADGEAYLDDAQSPPLIRPRAVPLTEPGINPPATARGAERQLHEEDLTNLDKAALMSSYSTLSQVQEAAESREPYAQYYEVFAEKARQRGRDVLLEALDRKASL